MLKRDKTPPKSQLKKWSKAHDRGKKFETQINRDGQTGRPCKFDLLRNGRLRPKKVKVIYKQSQPAVSL